METRAVHPADVRIRHGTTCHVRRHRHDGGDKCCDMSDTHLHYSQQSVRSHNEILNPFFRFIHRFSGRRRLSDYHEETRHVSPRREEVILQTTGCDNNCSSSSQSYQQQPNPSKSSNSEEQRSLGPCSTTTKVYNTQESSQFSQLQLCLLYLVLVTLISCTDACSSRSTPRPRPPSPTMRPNITFQTYACPPAYAAWYCLNGATCFTVKIGRSILYNCECADGFMGQRCEFKDLDGTYVSSAERLKAAAAASLSTVYSASTNVFVGVIIIILGTALAALVYTKRRSRDKMRKIEEIRRQTLEHSCEQSQHEQQDISILDEGHCSRSSLSSVAAMTTSLNLSDSNCLFHRDASISFHESETSLSTSTQSSRSHGSSSHSTSTPVSHLQECPLSSLPEMLPNDNSAYQSIENEESLLQSSSLTASLPSYAKQTVRGRWWRRSQDDQEDDGAGAVMKGTISYNVRSHPITGPHLQLEPSQVQNFESKV